MTHGLSMLVAPTLPQTHYPILDVLACALVRTKTTRDTSNELAGLGVQMLPFVFVGGFGGPRSISTRLGSLHLLLIIPSGTATLV